VCGCRVPEAAQLARLLRRQVEQPEVLRRKRSLAYTSARPFGTNRYRFPSTRSRIAGNSTLVPFARTARSGASTLTLAPVYTIRSPDGDHTGSRAAPAANRTGLPRSMELEQPRSTLVDAPATIHFPSGDQQIDPEYQSDPPAIGDRRLLPTDVKAQFPVAPQDYSHFTPIGRDRRPVRTRLRQIPSRSQQPCRPRKRHRPSPVPCEDK